MNRAFPPKQIPDYDEFIYIIRDITDGSFIDGSKERKSSFKLLEELALKHPDREFVLYRAVKAMKNKSTTTHQLLAKDLE